jgi:hypothetical protein
MHPGRVYRSRAALADAFGLRLGDTLKLALASHVGFEFGEYAERVQETFSGAVPVSTGGRRSRRTLASDDMADKIISLLPVAPELTISNGAS